MDITLADDLALHILLRILSYANLNSWAGFGHSTSVHDLGLAFSVQPMTEI
jgi:hypothetical protein